MKLFCFLGIKIMSGVTVDDIMIVDGSEMEIVSVFTKNVIIDLHQDKNGKIDVKVTARNPEENIVIDYFAGGTFDDVNEKHAAELEKVDQTFSIFDTDENEWDF